ncbi:ATP-dependent DNA ligase [Streptomyces massasporeus]|uniref:ATP-dependent DNA ligase n=1 Tax=Streptomyces massasporeus TaxID=67324 RepID=UPI0033325033
MAGAAQLPNATALDGELVVWEEGRLAFERLQNRLQRRGAGATRAADEAPAHFVTFDLLRLSGTNTTRWSYQRRRAALESLFAARQLTAPWALCPSTTDAEAVREWLTWGAVGMEEVVYKRLDGAYEPGVRGWLKYKVRETTEAIVGAVTGPAASPRGLLLGRYDDQGRLQYVGRTTTLARATGNTIGSHLTPGEPGHPWTGWTFSAGWGTQRALEVHLVQPDVVMEVAIDVALDSAGRWRHPARAHRVRTDIGVDQVPLFGE